MFVYWLLDLFVGLAKMLIDMVSFGHTDVRVTNNGVKYIQNRLHDDKSYVIMDVNRVRLT